MNFSIEDKFTIILLNQYQLNSYIAGYHAYTLK